MFRRIFWLVFLFPVFLICSSAPFQAGQRLVVSNAMVELQRNKEAGHFRYVRLFRWSSRGISGFYPLADVEMPRYLCRSSYRDADSLLGFCRAYHLYHGLTQAAWKLLDKRQPHQYWLEKIYQNHVTAYQRLAVRDCEKPAAELLAYSTCAEVPGEVLKSHLGKVREAINGGTWTLADAYVFLGVYPSKHYFGWGDLSREDEEAYALCIADSLKAILVAEKEEKWDEIVRQAKEAEAAEREFEERFSSWGSEDVQRKELQCQQTGSEKRSDDQSELDRLYKLDVARAYLFLAVKCS